MFSQNISQVIQNFLNVLSVFNFKSATEDAHKTDLNMEVDETFGFEACPKNTRMLLNPKR